MMISVVIPMFNASRSILSTLNSVKDQTYKNFEIIIVNDGSTDECGNIVADYILANPNLKINYIEQKNSGVSAARNCGMKHAKGDWIALLDSDDVWLPNKLKRQMEILESNKNIDFLGTSRNGEIIKSSMLKGKSNLYKVKAKQLLFRMFFITPTIIFKKKILSDMKAFPVDQKFCEDGNFYIRVAKKGKSYFLNESLAFTGGGKAHFGEAGLSSNLWGMESGELENIKLALKIGIINKAEYAFFVAFSLMKYFRRVIIVKIKFSKLRKQKK